MNYFEKANSFYNERKFSDAFELYKKSIEKGETSGSSFYNAAVCLIKLKKYKEAVAYLKEAIATRSDSKYFFNLGYCHAMMNEHNLALQYFNTAWSYDNFDSDSEKAIALILKLKRNEKGLSS